MRSTDRPSSQLEDFGITPVFRAERPLASGRVAYLEVAAGAFLLSDDRVSPSRVFGGRFSFGDHGAIGLRGARWEVQVRFQHFSNADLRQPNDGINFAAIRFGYRFGARAVK